MSATAGDLLRRLKYHPVLRTLHGLRVRRWLADVDERDVLLASYPRSGNTWMRASLLSYLSPADRKFEFQDLDREVPHLGDHARAARLLPDQGRLIKAHDLVAAGATRTIYLLRDPRDVVLSSFRLWLRAQRHDSPFQNFLERFLDGRAHYFGRWDEHVRLFSEAGCDTLVVRYEDLRADPVAGLRKLCVFLVGTVDERRIAEALEYASFERLREMVAVRDQARPVRREHPFVGKGKVGGWKDVLEADQARAIASAFGETMERFGYSIDTEPPDAEAGA